ncbi:MAG TPA: DUF4136 domain-containing protein [Pyrinomonadaceae bacterium]|nr:DUF4136 domain-containing protein [Pyrinomonadaceae bacterium]
MKSTTGLKVMGIAMLILLGCVSASAQDIKYNFMPGTDFTKYKSYRWARVPNVQYPDQIIDNQITQAIDAQLALKGLSKSGGETADLVVTYQAAVNQEKQWNSFSTGDSGGWGYGRWGGWGGYGGMSTTTTTSETINIGTLDVDIYDSAARNQIWKGQATKTLGSGKDPAKVNKNINKAMEKLFKKYPPPAKK